MKEQINKYWKILYDGTKTMFKEFFNKKTNKKQRANMWTFSRLTTSFLIPLCSLLSILTANISLFITSIGITAFGGLTDCFDGRSARKHNSFSEYGRLLDQISDKIFSLMVGINIALFNPLYLLTLLGEVLIVASNIPYDLKYKELKIKSTMMGKIKQWPLFTSLVLGFIAVLNPAIILAANISIITTFLFQIATIASYVKKNKNEVKKIKEKEQENDLIEIKDVSDKDKVKEKTLNEKNNNSQSKTTSKKELYINLRDLLNQVRFNKEQKNINSFQKQLKNDQN